MGKYNVIELIKMLMFIKSMRQVDLARSLGITRQTLNKRLNPKRAESLLVSTLVEMLGVMGCELKVVTKDGKEYTIE